MRFKYMTFDCYGTLIDWKAGIERNFAPFANGADLAGADVFNSYVSLEAEEESSYKPYTQVLYDTSLRLAKKLGLEQSQGAARAFADSITGWPAFSDTAAALREFGRLGCTRVILSNIDKKLLEGTIRNNGLEVDGFITAEQVGSYKPNKRHWMTFFDKYGAQKNEVLHVANSVYHDIVPATELGLKTVWVNRYGEKLTGKVKPTYLANNLADIAGILE